MKQVTEQNFKEEVLQSNGVVLADFYADWCGPCKFLSPELETLEKEIPDPQVKFVKINVDQNQELAGMYGIMSIPTVVIFKDGKIAEQKTGVAPKNEYKKAIEKAKSYVPSEVKEEVTVFTTPTCPYCNLVKTYLKEKNVSFKEIDVSSDMAEAMKMVEKSGQMAVPQTWINNQVIIGFNKPQFEALLNT